MMVVVPIEESRRLARVAEYLVSGYGSVGFNSLVRPDNDSFDLSRLSVEVSKGCEGGESGSH